MVGEWRADREPGLGLQSAQGAQQVGWGDEEAPLKGFRTSFNIHPILPVSSESTHHFIH